MIRLNIFFHSCSCLRIALLAVGLAACGGNSSQSGNATASPVKSPLMSPAPASTPVISATAEPTPPNTLPPTPVPTAQPTPSYLPTPVENSDLTLKIDFPMSNTYFGGYLKTLPVRGRIAGFNGGELKLEDIAELTVNGIPANLKQAKNIEWRAEIPVDVKDNIQVQVVLKDIYGVASSKLFLVHNNINLSDFSLAAFDEKNNRLFLLGNLDDKSVIHSLDLASGVLSPIYVPGEDEQFALHDVQDMIFDSSRDELLILIADYFQQALLSINLTTLQRTTLISRDDFRNADDEFGAIGQLNSILLNPFEDTIIVATNHYGSEPYDEYDWLKLTYRVGLFTYARSNKSLSFFALMPPDSQKLQVSKFDFFFRSDVFPFQIAIDSGGYRWVTIATQPYEFQNEPSSSSPDYVEKYDSIPWLRNTDNTYLHFRTSDNSLYIADINYAKYKLSGPDLGSGPIWSNVDDWFVDSINRRIVVLDKTSNCIYFVDVQTGNREQLKLAEALTPEPAFPFGLSLTGMFIEPYWQQPVGPLAVDPLGQVAFYPSKNTLFINYQSLTETYPGYYSYFFNGVEMNDEGAVKKSIIGTSDEWLAFGTILPAVLLDKLSQESFLFSLNSTDQSIAFNRQLYQDFTVVSGLDRFLNVFDFANSRIFNWVNGSISTKQGAVIGDNNRTQISVIDLNTNAEKVISGTLTESREDEVGEGPLPCIIKSISLNKTGDGLYVLNEQDSRYVCDSNNGIIYVDIASGLRSQIYSDNNSAHLNMQVDRENETAYISKAMAGERFFSVDLKTGTKTVLLPSDRSRGLDFGGRYAFDIDMERRRAYFIQDRWGAIYVLDLDTATVGMLLGRPSQVPPIPN